MCSDAPDMSGANAAALANAELSKEALAFYKEVYAEQAPMREKAADIATRVSDAQLASMQKNDAIADDYWKYQKETFRPLEQQLVQEAQDYDTPERRDAAAGKAVADVGIQMGNARAAATRSQQRMGVNPSSGAALSMTGMLSASEAAAKAGAANTARDKVETVGRAMKFDAANLGRNLASNQSTSAGLALNAGNSAAGNAQMPVQQAQSAASMMGQGFNTAIQGNSSAGQLYGMAANAQPDNSGIWGAVGTVAGAMLGGPMGAAAGAALARSDEQSKKNVRPVSEEQALKAVEQTPVSSWTYKEGEGDGGSHVGPMAQAVNDTMGEKAAPGGKQIDLITMNGVTMASVAALSRKVRRLERQLEGAEA